MGCHRCSSGCVRSFVCKRYNVSMSGPPTEARQDRPRTGARAPRNKRYAAGNSNEIDGRLLRCCDAAFLIPMSTWSHTQRPLKSADYNNSIVVVQQQYDRMGDCCIHLRRITFVLVVYGRCVDSRIERGGS